MKTAEEILDNKNLHWTYAPNGDHSKPYIHDCDCRFCEVETPVLEAMTEYVAQYKADNDRLREALEEIVSNNHKGTMALEIAINALNLKEKEV